MLKTERFSLYLWDCSTFFCRESYYCDASISNQSMSAYHLGNIQNMLSQEGSTKALKGWV